MSGTIQTATVIMTAAPDNTSGILTPAMFRNAAISAASLPFQTKVASYTAALGDEGILTIMNLTGTANNFTIPTNASVAFQIGTCLHVGQQGTGVTTIVTTSLTIINSATNVLRTQGSIASCLKVATDTWWLWGDLA
jgi:hypothetical protein